jgi:formylglycine-generating enzyme required for sulfatase activity
MMRTVLSTIFQFITIFCYAQQTKIVSGTIKDSFDNATVSYASIAVAGSNTGTLSDSNGYFKLTLTDEQSNGLLTISCLGYLSQKVKVADIKPSGNILFLQRTAFVMREIAVSPSQKMELTAKMIEQMMARISDTLYMCKYEVPRYLYRAFLQDICANGDSACEEAGFHYTQTTYHGKFGYQSQVAIYNIKEGLADKLPVSDITYEGARQFCLWLTKRYSEFKNRKFKNAVFRLPASSEWTYAAQGDSRLKTRFPWPGDSAYYYRPGDTLHCHPNDSLRVYYVLYDGGIYRSENLGGAYFSVFSGHKYKYGLKNILGNAAEMVQEKGIYRGGSSMDKLENIGIYAPQDPDRKDPDYFIGFRFAMIKN